MRKKFLIGVAVLVLGLTLRSTPVQALPVLDFNGTVVGGLITDLGLNHFVGAGILLPDLHYFDTGGGIDQHFACIGCVLNFDTANPAGVGVTITGLVNGVAGVLLSGTFSSWNFNFNPASGNGTFTGFGIDFKNPALLASLGLGAYIGQPWSFDGSSLGFNVGPGGYVPFSNDWGNTPAVPEPASMLLLGTGLVGIARAVRRRRQLAATQSV